MCWNADVSLKTYLLGMTLAAFSKYKGSVDNATWIFLILFTHMQLVEYFLWKNMENPKQLELWSKIGSILIVSQPLFLMNMMKDSRLKWQLMAAYLVVVGGWFALKTKQFETRVGSNGHLEWNWFPTDSWGVVWAISWFVPLILSQNYKLLFLALAGFIPSVYYYLKYKTWGTMWCWISVFVWIFYIFI
jgi:hypothetical protein